MAYTHIAYDKTSPHGNLLFSMLTNLETGFDSLNDLIATMQTMIDGDGSQAAHFAYMAGQFGFPSQQAPDGAVAKAAWDELLSLQSKLNTDSSVSFVKAAMLQAFSKFR